MRELMSGGRISGLHDTMLMNKRIATRFLIGYSLPIACLIGLGGAVYFNARHTFERQAETELARSTIIGVDEMALGVSRMVRNTRGYILFPGDASYLESYEEGFRLFQEAQQHLKQQNINPELQAKIDIFLEETNANNEISRSIFNLVDAGNIDEAKNLTQLIRMNKIDEIREEIVSENQAFLSLASVEEEKAQSLLIIATLSGTLLSIIFTLIVSLWIAKQTSQKLNQGVAMAEQISTGDLTARANLNAASRDEIDQLLSAFQTMTDSLNSLIRQVQRSGIQITSSATQIAASGKQLEATATEQTASTHEVRASAQEIAATSAGLAQTVEAIVLKAQHTTQAASSSRHDLGRMETTMRQLFTATQSIANKLELIHENANNINSIVTAITKVADQVNLLSLNAAIEAEKAGEYGAGFSVVAREIRRLADQTAVSALDIEHKVREMQTAVSMGVMETDKFTQEVKSGVNVVSSISEQLQQIIEQVQDLAPNFEIVGQGTENQAQSAQQINEAMVQLSETSVQTASALQEINLAIAQLNQAARVLQQEISRFTTTQREELAPSEVMADITYQSPMPIWQS